MELQEASLRHRLEKYPDDFRANLNIGALRLALLDAGQAEQALRAAARAEPGRADAHNMLGVALNTLGRLQEAIAQFRVAINLRSDYLSARFNLANALEKAGNRDEAIEQMRQAAAANPDDRLVKERLAAMVKAR